MSEEKLKSCPWCGGEPAVDRSFEDVRGPSCYIHCAQCDCGPGDCYRPAHEWEQAVAAWNKRVPTPPDISALVSALEPFAAQPLSTEPYATALVLYSPAEEMRRKASLVEQRDAEILEARRVLQAHKAGGAS